jgi:hypothetical protein
MLAIHVRVLHHSLDPFGIVVAALTVAAIVLVTGLAVAGVVRRRAAHSLHR